MNKIEFSRMIWWDTETGGIDPDRNPVIQLGAIIEIGGEVVDEREWQVRPQSGTVVTRESLRINHIHEEDLKKSPEAGLVIRQLLEFADKHNPSSRLIPAGFNVEFDNDFIRSMFKRNFFFGKNTYSMGAGELDALERQSLSEYWFRFYPHSLDVRNVAVLAGLKGCLPVVDNMKLTTLTAACGIVHEQAHTALSDIRATRELYYNLLERMGIK